MGRRNNQFTIKILRRKQASENGIPQPANKPATAHPRQRECRQRNAHEFKVQGSVLAFSSNIPEESSKSFQERLPRSFREETSQIFPGGDFPELSGRRLPKTFFPELSARNFPKLPREIPKLSGRDFPELSGRKLSLSFKL